MRLTLLVTALALNACVSVDIQRSEEMPIAAVRLQKMNTPVTAGGVVTVAPGSLDEGFALQDESGGIYVARTTGAALKLGDRVRVSGKIVLPNAQIAIAPERIDAMGTGNVPAAGAVNTGAVGPPTEGRLVSVHGKIIGDVVDDQPWGWKLYLDDGSGRLLVFIATATRIDAKQYRAGQWLRATGFSGRYEQHTELLPRAPGDIVEHSGPGR